MFQKMSTPIILKAGKVDELVNHEFKCKKCECEFAYNQSHVSQSDMKWRYDNGRYYEYYNNIVTCPQIGCHVKIVVNSKYTGCSKDWRDM